MRKNILFLPLLFLLACGESQTNYIHINGTRVLMQPPTGFIQPKNFIGLQKNTNEIAIYDYQENYYNQKLFGKEAFEDQGVQLLKEEYLKVDGYEGRLLNIQFAGGILGDILIFGDSTFYAVVIAKYHKDEKETGKDMIESILTLKYDKLYTPQLVSIPTFTLEDSGSAFKLEQFSTNGSVYSLGGIKRTSEKEPYLQTSFLPDASGESTENVVKTVLEVMGNVGFENIKIDSSSSLKINNHEAYQCQATALNKGVETVLYILAATDGKAMVTVQGFCTNDFDKNMAEFQNLAKTINFPK